MQTFQDKQTKKSEAIEMPRPIAVNGRYRAHKVAGQQRYANELIRRMGPSVRMIEPATPLKGIRGHLWEQFVLPRLAGSSLLWSPCQSGPAIRAHQVVTFHDIFALENPEWFSTGYARWYGQTIPRLARTAKHLIAVSEFTKQRLLTVLNLPDDRITVIHSGIGEEFRPQSPDEIDRMHSRLKLPSRKYVLSVSSLEPRKNLPRILEAWKAVAPRLGDDYWLVLAGGKGSAGVFANQDLSDSVPRVHRTGYVDDALLPALYAGATVFVYPSLAEGFGLPVLEAMSCGAPALTADSSSLPEVAGDAALKVNPLLVSGIADAMFALAASPALQEEMSGRGLRQALRFSWDRAAEQTLKVLRTADRGRKARAHHA